MPLTCFIHAVEKKNKFKDTVTPLKGEHVIKKIQYFNS